MRILFDHGTPKPLRKFLPGHEIRTAFEEGWSEYSNGELLTAAQNDGFALLITTDQNLRYQQNLAKRTIGVLTLPTTSWPEIRRHTSEIAAAVLTVKPGAFIELDW